MKRRKLSGAWYEKYLSRYGLTDESFFERYSPALRDGDAFQIMASTAHAFYIGRLIVNGELPNVKEMSPFDSSWVEDHIVNIIGVEIFDWWFSDDAETRHPKECCATMIADAFTLAYRILEPELRESLKGIHFSIRPDFAGAKP